MRELYAEYRAFAVPKGTPRFEKVEDELLMLGRYAPIYETLEGRKKEDADLHWFGRKLATWQVTTAYPITMQISASALAQEDKQHLYRLIYSFIVRRALSGLTPKNMNRVFQSLADVFVEEGPSLEAFRGYFSDRVGTVRASRMIESFGRVC